MTGDREPSAGSGAMFDRIAHRYDLLNRVLSLGNDQRWRRRAVRALDLNGRAHPIVLDLATGTADLALLTARHHAGSRVVGLDPAQRMLAIGQSKARAEDVPDRVHLVTGDAQSLPLPDASVDGVTMAFGIRNVPDRALALREMRRVTRPGSRIAILELTEPEGNGLLARAARFHVHALVPRIGALLSGAREYAYLQASIAAFPPPERFATMMEEAGLEVVRVDRILFGVCHLFVGTRP
jgi:demethylmenaquinone methyltransferase/2-methoxy-6-polyprenyl-1,4-benzoquinol methylase